MNTCILVALLAVGVLTTHLLVAAVALLPAVLVFVGVMVATRREGEP